MASHTLTPMKKVEIVVDGEQVQAVKDALSEASVSGYTILGNVSGMGHHGRHEVLVYEVDHLVPGAH